MLTTAVLNASTWIDEKLDKSYTKKEFSIKSGKFPTAQNIENIHNAKVYIMDMNYNVKDFNLTNAKIDFSAPYKGSYHIFLEHKYVKDNTLFIELSKLRTYNKYGDIKESLIKEVRGKSSASHYDMKPLKEIPFEIIIKKPIKNHHINCCLYSGDIARFQIYFKGKLQNNIPLTVSTQLGWTNSVLPLDDGIISFEIPRDKYISTTLDKRYKESLLIEANYTTKEVGIYNGNGYSKINYSMTMPLTFHTSPLEYSAKLPAYLIVAGVILIFTFGVYYYRKRKQKFHKEICFEEN
jgi:hypothetical protein